MGGETPVRFWRMGGVLFLQNLLTKEVKLIRQPTKIQMFLLAHNLSLEEVKAPPLNGRDVVGVFDDTQLIDITPFLKKGK